MGAARKENHRGYGNASRTCYHTMLDQRSIASQAEYQQPKYSIFVMDFNIPLLCSFVVLASKFGSI